MKEPKKSHQQQTPFQVNVRGLPQGVYKAVWHNGFNIHIESSGVF